METKEELMLIRNGLLMLLGVMNATGDFEKANKVDTLIQNIQYKIRYYNEED